MVNWQDAKRPQGRDVSAACASPQRALASGVGGGMGGGVDGARRAWLNGALACGAVGLGLVGLAGCGQVQTRLPDLPYAELDGSRHRTHELLGRVALIHFWATSCTTCMHEMPKLIATHRRLHDQGLETLAVAMSYDPPAYVVAFAQSRQLPFRVAIDLDGSLARGFGDVQLTPTTLVVDRQGQIVKRYVGEPQFDAFEQTLQGLLRGASA